MTITSLSHKIFACAAAIAVFSATAMAAATPAQKPGWVRQRQVESRDLTSKEGLKYRLIISAPMGNPPPAGFPVIYVVDGNTYGPLVADIARLQEGAVGPTIVVGIGYQTDALIDFPRRSYDLTPPGALAHPPDEAEKNFKFGGADQFLGFIKHEVKPAIESQFKIDRSRQALFGHSLGGLFVLHVLFVDPDAFHTFVAVSPSIWWNDRVVLKDEAAFAKAAARNKVRVLLEAGAREAALDPEEESKIRTAIKIHPDALGGRAIDQVIDKLRSDLAGARMVDNARELAERLKGVGVDAKFAVFPDEDHNSVAVGAFNRGISFAAQAPN